MNEKSLFRRKYESIKENVDFLMKPLILPSLIFATVFIAGSFFVVSQNFRLTWQGLLSGLGVTFVGIIITVSYVNWVLKEQEMEKWKNVDIDIDGRIKNYLKNIIISFHMTFVMLSNKSTNKNYDEHIKKLFEKDIEKRSIQEIIEMGNNVNEKIEHKMDPKRTGSIDQELLDNFVKEIQYFQETLLTMIDLFGNRIEPQTLHALLQIEDSLSTFIKLKLQSTTLKIKLESLPSNSSLKLSEGLEKGLNIPLTASKKLKEQSQEILRLTLELMENLKQS